MLLLTVLLAAGVGVSLGLLGGGGSILAVPLLVSVGGLDAQPAVAVSLLVVAVTSAVGVLPHARAHRVRWRAGLTFAPAGMAGAYLGGRLAALVPGTVLLSCFAAVMLIASLAMIRGRRGTQGSVARPAALVPLGAAVGTLTGFVGAGGGFMIVPALTLVGGLSMTEAVGTSLLVISLQSAAGLGGHLSGTSLPLALTAGVTGSAVLGSLAGARLGRRVQASALRVGFGWFVMVVGALVLAQQLPEPFTFLPLLLPALLGALTLLRRRSAASRPGHSGPGTMVWTAPPPR